MSTTWSATIFFSRVFSCSSVFSRLSVWTSMPLYCFRHRWYVASLTSRRMQASAIVAPPLNSASASRSFRTICSGSCRFFIIESFPLPRSLDSHCTWLRCPGAGQQQELKKRADREAANLKKETERALELKKQADREAAKSKKETESALARAEQERVSALAKQEAELEKQRLLEVAKAEQELQKQAERETAKLEKEKELALAEVAEEISAS